jgi:hypothetical protein
MIICSRCGNQNPLGRVFCGTCGAKLDLTHMTTENVSQMTRRARIFNVKWLSYIASVILVVLLILAGLAIWADTEVIGKEGTRLGGDRVGSGLRLMSELKAGRTLNREFPEDDINGYFKFMKAQSLEVDSVTVQVTSGRFQVHVVRTLTSIRIGTFSFQPKVSYDLYCVPVGGRVRIVGARIGHLRWLGPARSSIIGRVYHLFSSQKEWAAFENLVEVKAEAGKITAQASR